jgi:pimeloyl-ACP methyl ester carboxylesterase
MPTTETPDGTELWWEVRGEGPLVAIALFYYSPPTLLGPLIDDLARDHRVLTYDPRGTGRSTRQGPYDRETDAADLNVVLEASGPAAVAVGMGDGADRAVRAAAARPDLLDAVVVPGGVTIRLEPGPARSGLAASASVLTAFATLLETDYRAGLHTMLSSGDSTLSEETIRERIDEIEAYCPREPGTVRLREWIADDVSEQAAAIGDRLWLLSHDQNAWFPVELLEEMRAHLPDARVVDIEDGAINRPDLTAAIVRRITASAG